MSAQSPDSSDEAAPRNTLPPPELYHRAAPVSVGTLVLAELMATTPVARHSGPQAREAYLRAELRRCVAAGEPGGERGAALELAERLVERGAELGEAVVLAQRALALGEDEALRRAVAGWLAGLGRPAEAAALLEPLCEGPDAGATLVDVAVLYGRAGDGESALEALARAAALLPSDAMPCELRGTVMAWAPDAATPAEAAAAYLEAARRRAAEGDEGAASDDRLRAFEAAPADEAVAEALSEAYRSAGNLSASDAVLRAHAEALTGGVIDGARLSQDAHAKRMLAALERGDIEVALVACFDAELEGRLEGDMVERVDDLLVSAGLHELFAARLQLRCAQGTRAERGHAAQALARLCSGPLGSPERAIEAWIIAAQSDPSCKPAWAALRDHASTKDSAPFLEAAIRVGSQPEAGASRLEVLRWLGAYAETGLADAALAMWAYAQVAAVDAAEDAQAAIVRLEARARHEDERLAEARAQAASDSSEGHEHALSRLVELLAYRPDDELAYVEALAALAELTPNEPSHLRALERLSGRATVGDAAAGALLRLMRSRLAVADSLDPGARRAELVRARTALSALARRRDEGEALAQLAPLLDEAPLNRDVAALALLLATRTGSTADRAAAMVQVAGSSRPSTRAALLAFAAELHLELGAIAQAQRLAQEAHDVAPQSPVVLSVRAQVAPRDYVGAATIERSMQVGIPRTMSCASLAETLEELGELELALAWTERWLALRPGAIAPIRASLKRAAALGDPQHLGDALTWVLVQPRPLAELEEVFTFALGALFEADAEGALGVGANALDVFGPGHGGLAAKLLEMAERAGDAALRVVVLERLACESADAALALDLAEARRDAGDFDGSAGDLARAARLGADPEAVVASGDATTSAAREAGATLSSDAVVALAEARVMSLALDPSVDTELLVSATRWLGSVRWDLADDREGAERALFDAATVSGAQGYALYVRDLAELGGAAEAVKVALARGAELATPERAKDGAGLLIAAASLALANELYSEALEASTTALHLDPSRADTLALVEKSATDPSAFDALSGAYDTLATAALGRYGRRAAHYRAARHFERRGAIERALRHAVICFEAVPDEGTSYRLLTRIARRSVGSDEAVRTLVRVAEASPDHVRPAWLMRAASLAMGFDGAEATRFDLMLRVLPSQPEVSVVEATREALEALLASGADREPVLVRFEDAAALAMTKLEGPDGARTALAIARAALSVGRTPSALGAIERATRVDGDIDEYDALLESVPVLATEEDAAHALLLRIESETGRRFATVGAAQRRLASALAERLGDGALSVRLSVLPPGDSDDAPAADEDDWGMGDDEELDDQPDVPSADGSAAESSASPSPPDVIEPQRSATTTVEPAVDGLAALEQDAAERRDYVAMCAIIARRIELSDDPELRRILRLRRVALLEQRLDQPEQARAELEAMVEQAPDDASALRYLADLYDQGREPARAAALFQRVMTLTTSSDERWAYGLRASRGYLAGGEPELAQAILDALDEEAPRHVTAELRAEVARAIGDDRALASALEELASTSNQANERRADWLFEAARLASARGDDALALDHARSSMRFAPARADAVLEAMRLEYRARGAGTPREAQACVDALMAMESSLQPADVELYAFLLAEELDVIQGGGAGMRELSRRHAELGPKPLIALGMAERLARHKSFDAALPLFQTALTGDLSGLRSPGRVALTAAEAAMALDRHDLAQSLLERAASDPAAEAEAVRRMLMLAIQRGDFQAARAALEHLLTTARSTGERARSYTEFGRAFIASHRDEAFEALTSALELYAEGTADRRAIEAEIASLQPTSSVSAAPAPEAAAVSITEPDDAAASGEVDGVADLGLAAEEDLLAQLAGGSFPAGEVLAARYAEDCPARSSELLRVRRQQAQLRPGHRATLGALHAAATADGAQAFAQAVEHVLRCFSPDSKPLRPPPLSAQHAAPELVAPMLLRTTERGCIAALDAVALVGEMGLFRRDPASYALTGLERVQPSSTTTLGQLYGSISPLLGLTRVALFHRRIAAPLSTEVALLAPPALVLIGEAKDATPALRYALGAGLMAASPRLALAMGLADDTLTALVAALHAAFGPVDSVRSSNKDSLRLQQELWQLVTPPIERQLQERLAEMAEMIPPDAVRAVAKQATRRAGLFAAGNLATAIKAVVAELSLKLPEPLHVEGALERACEAEPVIADLVRLATSLEYAELRWAAAPADALPSDELSNTTTSAL